MDLLSVLGSNGFQTLIMFLTGSVALVIYFLNKRAEKREAAQIIIGEIRLAEEAIRQIKNSKVMTDQSIILPNNTWDSKKHLFLDLDQDEFALINDFYTKCTFAEQYRKMYLESLNSAVLAKAVYLQEKLIDVMYDTVKDKTITYEDAKMALLEKANKEAWLFDSERLKISFFGNIEGTTQITTTSAGTKIKKIGKIK